LIRSTPARNSHHEIKWQAAFFRRRLLALMVRFFGTASENYNGGRFERTKSRASTSLVNGVWRTFRDKESAAYDAANALKRRWLDTAVTIQKPDGSVVTC